MTPPADPAASARPASPMDDLVRELRARRFTVPVAGITADRIAPSFHDGRGGHVHEALDILAPRGTAVLAVEDGTIAKLFWSNAGGHTIYQFDPSRRFAYYYAHLDRYADGLTDGQTVRRGDVIGFVGTTGNANAETPHLHFAIFQLTPERHWWEGTPIDPYPVLRWAVDPSP
jgi:murein DD-endopeptidase MepM/ murein hydrolase activator NlpD